MKKTIDIILPNLAIGGAEKVMLLLAEQFKTANFEVRFIVRRLTEGGFQDLVEKDFQLVNLNAKKVRQFPIKLNSLYNHLQKPDIILVSLWPLTFLTAITLKLKSKSPKVICIEHGSLKYQTQKKSKFYQIFLKWSLKITLKLCDKLVCVSEGLKSEIQDLAGYKSPKLISIPNPVKLDATTAGDSISESLKDQLKGHIFLSLGRLKKVKNIPLLLRAFKMVSKEVYATLLIVGDGPESDNLKALTESLGIRDKVLFTGFKKHCGPYYRIADSFVLSSDSEGFGNVIVEALAEGCTVVATNCPYGPKEILDGGNFGYLASVNNVEELANTMLKAVKQPFPKEILKQRAAFYSPSSVTKFYLEIFNSFK
ncbi:glycosyltransferase [Salinimicrobium sp. CAU 1759]